MSDVSALDFLRQFGCLFNDSGFSHSSGRTPHAALRHAAFGSVGHATMGRQPSVLHVNTINSVLQLKSFIITTCASEGTAVRTAGESPVKDNWASFDELWRSVSFLGCQLAVHLVDNDNAACHGLLGTL